jgi:hypothetical protein
VKQALLGNTAIAGQPIEIWFQDEARIGQKGGCRVAKKCRKVLVRALAAI